MRKYKAMQTQTVYQSAPFPAQITAQHKADFERDGFLAFTDVLSAAEIEAAKSALSEAIQNLRSNHRAGGNDYGNTWNAPDGNLSIQFERTGAPIEADDPDLELKIRKYHNVIEAAPAVEATALRHPKLRAVLDAVLGREALLTQDMALVKPPGGVAKPWHQDDAYFKIAPLTAVCGVWIALDDAGVENGCMQVWRGGHQVGALRHYHADDCEIVPDRLTNEQTLAVPLPPGGALFFSGLLPHQTPINNSNLRRRALQFHYRSLDSRYVDDDEYNAIFVERDGSPASCKAATARGF